MSLSNEIHISLLLPNINIFTFGESNLYGYDSLNNCLIILSLKDLNNINENKINRYYLSSKPKYLIEKLIINQDETIITLISQQIAYLIYLPQINNLSLKNSYICPLDEINSIISNDLLINNNIIDFLWLSPIHFLIVNSIPSSNQCHLYLIQSSKSNRIKFIQTFTIESSSSTIKQRNSLKSNKKINLNQLSDIVKLNLIKRKKEELTLILIFALKSNGDFFVMEINENELNNNNKLLCSFIGPINIIPSRIDNYGYNHNQSNFICLFYFELIIIILIHNKYEINHFIYLNPSKYNYYLYNINLINLNNKLIKYIINDKLYLNKYFICDSLSNIYSIELVLFNKNNLNHKTIIKHIIQSNLNIQSIYLIQTNNKGQWLSFISNTLNNQIKELIFIRPYSLTNNLINENSSLIQIKKPNLLNESSEFLNRIYLILNSKDKSFPQINLSSKIINISNEDFKKNLLKFIKIFQKEYLLKQEKVRFELENKQKYLFDFQQTQLIAYQELNTKFNLIQQTFQLLIQQYQQEFERQKKLLLNVNDLLSIIEENNPILSDGEILMFKQLQIYYIQINSLKQKIHLLKQFLSKSIYSNNQQQQQHIDQTSLQTFIQYYRDYINKIKQQIENIHHQ